MMSKMMSNMKMGGGGGGMDMMSSNMAQLMMDAPWTGRGTPPCEQLCVESMKDAEDWETFTSGPQVMEARMMIATVMGTRPPCGPSPSTPPSTRGRMRTTTRAVRAHWPPPSVMARATPTLAWPRRTCTVNAPKHIQGHLQQLPRLLVCLPSHWRPTVTSPGETCNILLFSPQRETHCLMQRTGSFGP